MPGLDALERKPILVLDDSDAWEGSPESLPVLTVYEDGLAVTAAWENKTTKLETGHVDDPRALARTIYLELVDLAPRITVSAATDQPEVTISARVGEAWRAVNVVGFRGAGEVAAKTADPPPPFVRAYRTLTDLHLRDRRPYQPDVFVVTLTDDTVPSASAAPWPTDVPAPPSNLVPDAKWVGRPRTYDLRGDAGAELEAFAKARNGYGVRTPSGDRVSIQVHASVPAGDYIEMLMYCKLWKREPYHDCVRKLPGRP